MSYTVTIATEDTRRLVVEALRAGAEQRGRVARKYAGELAAEKRTGKDTRAGSVKVVAILAQADDLARVADQLEAATDVPVVTNTPGPLPDPWAEATPAAGGLFPVPGLTDDGTSLEAQRIAALAGLEATSPDGEPEEPVEDPVTHALPEDVPAPDEIEEVLTP